VNRVVRGALPAALVGLLFTSASAADEKGLTEQEKVFLHAAGLLVEDPGNDKDLVGRAKESIEKGADKKWAKSENLVLKALASIEEKPLLRERYRTSLKSLLGDEPEANTKKLIAQLETSYTKDKIQEYSNLIEKAAVAKLERGSLPWPVCIPFDCCK
jgi:hypothetical protein